MLSLNTWLKSNWQPTYFVFSIIYLLSLEHTPYRFSWLLKITPIMILIIYTYLQPSRKLNFVFMLGLLFSILGDFILEYFTNQAFVFGLASFFIAHCFYIFCLGRWNSHLFLKFNRKNLYSILVVAYGSMVIMLIVSQLGDLLIPVLAYMLILFTMTISTLFSYQSNKWLMLGGVSFMISDSLIGLNKFYLAFDYSNLLIMLSYFLAQYFLVKGFFKRTHKI